MTSPTQTPAPEASAEFEDFGGAEAWSLAERRSSPGLFAIDRRPCQFPCMEPTHAHPPLIPDHVHPLEVREDGE